MKNTIYVLLVLILTSCEKFLEHDNPTQVTDDNWWNIQADATNALNSIYDGIPDGSSGRQLIFLEGLSDNAVARQALRGDYEGFSKGLQGPDWGVGTGVWRDDYRNIRRANRFLENIDRVYMADADLKRRYTYEARALRAYYHMELMLFFGGVPIVTKDVTPAESYLKRNSEKEVYDFVISELTESANNLPNVYTNSADLRRISGAGCWALITRLALYNNDYVKAKDAAKKIIDMGSTYALYKATPAQNSYADLFLYAGEINKERIFFKEMTGSGLQWETFAPQGTGGKTVLSPTASIVNAYETKQGKTIQELGPDSLSIYQKDPNYRNNRDPRLAASVLLPGQTFSSVLLNPFNANVSSLDRLNIQNSTSTGFWIKKHLDPKDRTGTRTLDFMIIRYAEVLLSYVEALVELNDWQNPDVVKYLNEIRNRAGMPNVNVAGYNTRDKMRELIRRERRVELAFEGVRYYDIRRWGIFKTVMNGPVFGAVNPSTNQPVEVETRTAREERDKLWPIPQGEVLSNPNMVQNPNY